MGKIIKVMMVNNKRIERSLLILFSIILLIEFLFSQAFPVWDFKSTTLVTINRIATYLSFFGFIYFLLLTFKMTSWLKHIAGPLFIIAFGVFSCSEIYPIDTTTKPEDVAILQILDNGRKKVIREYQNSKTNRLIRDTVLVKDVFIFRHIYKIQ